MNRSALSRLEKLEEAIKPAARQHIIFGMTAELAQAEFAARKASGEIADSDEVLIVTWRSSSAEPKMGATGRR
jgi:hypothetical protein